MKTTRRDFLRYCGMSAAALGLTATDLLQLEEAFANPSGPTVLWLQGAGCSGCSVSLLNRVSTQRPTSAADLLINSVNLGYHPTLMAAPGALAFDQAEAAYQKGGYILVVEGGVPTAFSGAACWAWTDRTGKEITFAQALTRIASRATKVVSVGSCASFGGIPAVGTNQAGIRGVSTYLARPAINVSGCPPHPDWMVWTLVQLMLGKTIALDSQQRPQALYARKIHEVCPLKGTRPSETLGVPNRCLKNMGCRGPETKSSCPSQFFNGGVNWCIGAGAPCIGCTESRFPGTTPFYNVENLD